MPGILSGLRIVEASAFVAAPLAGMTLAQLGVDVIRVDARQGGLDHHRWPVVGDDHSLFWCGLNKGKRSVALDLSSEEGREIAMALIGAHGRNAGLFVTNFPPRGWLDYRQLRARRADLIQVTLQGDRHGGAAVDYTVNPRLGLPLMTGPKDSADPVHHVLPAWDLITGHVIATGLLAALRRRDLTGQGQHVKLSLQDVALSATGHLGFIAEAQLGRPRQRHGNDLFGAFGRDFVTSDGARVMIVGLTPKQWRAVCLATGTVALMHALGDRMGLDLSKEGDRFVARAAIADLLGAWIAARTLAQAAAAFDAHGVCWSRYQTIEELVSSDPECSEANPMFAKVDQAGVGTILTPGAPFDFSAIDRVAPAPAPQLGQHTEEVLAQLLGIDGLDYARLHDRGIVA